MLTFRLKLMIASIALILMLGVGLIAVVRHQESGNLTPGDVPLFKTPAWATYDREEIERELTLHPDKTYTPTPRRAGELMLRLESQNGGALLLKHTAREPLYRYDPQTRSLQMVNGEVWERADGPIADCSKQFAPTASVLAVDKADTLRAGNGRDVSTAARVPLRLTAAPSGKLVAVLSADGPRRGATGLLSSSEVLGQRYHQVMSLPQAGAVGKPLRIPVINETDVPVACWSADEKYVVYHDYNFYSLSVLTTDLSSARIQ